MSQQLSPSEFLDRVILLLAARHGAHPTPSEDETEEYEQQQVRAWFEVSRDIQALAKAPSCRRGELRIASTQVDDAEAFSPQACINRAQFAMYRLEKEAREQNEKAKQAKKAKASMNGRNKSKFNVMTADQYVDPSDPRPSGFDITKGHSIAEAVNRIMEDCRARIMNINLSIPNDSSSDDDDDDENQDGGNAAKKPLEIYRPPDHIARSLMMTEEEAKRAMELGNAEEDLISKVQRLQTEHFKKYKRWINLGTGECMNPEVIASATNQLLLESNNSHGSSSSNDSSKKAYIGKLSADDVAEMLGKLNLGEHVGRFRRTTGHLLSSLSKDDIRLRFDNDNEATDILWAHIEENFTRENPALYGRNIYGNNNNNNQSPSTSPSSSSRPSLIGNPYNNKTSSSPSNSKNNNNNNNATSTKEASQMKAIYDAIAAPSRELMMAQHEAAAHNDQSSSLLLGSNGKSDASLKNRLLEGNFHALRRTLDILEGKDDDDNGGDDNDDQDDASKSSKHIPLRNTTVMTGSNGRPLRPSQEYKLMGNQHHHHDSSNHHGSVEDDDDENNEEENLQALTSGYLNRLANAAPSATTATTNNNAVSKNRQDNNYGRGGVGGRGGRGGGAAAATSAAVGVASRGGDAGGKGGRWNIVEYDSEEDNVE